jgi:glycosyltransferase involved in cell wall biosynthesis
MEKKQPLISILVPFFNRKKLLMECVNSIIQSSYSNIEVICIDDCSTDGTYKEIEKIASNDRRVRLYRNKRNIGIGLNRNLLISKAKGEYVMFVDSDDLIHKDLIKILYTAITKSNRNIAFCNYSSHINKVLNKDNSIPKQYVFNSSHEMLSYLFNGKNETKNQQEGLPFYSIYFFL